MHAIPCGFLLGSEGLNLTTELSPIYIKGNC